MVLFQILHGLKFGCVKADLPRQLKGATVFNASCPAGLLINANWPFITSFIDFCLSKMVKPNGNHGLFYKSNRNRTNWWKSRTAQHY